MSQADSLPALIERTRERFAQEAGPPKWTVAAPGRVNLIGEHTDYNDGFVLPMAIERYTVIAAGRPANPLASGEARVFSTGVNEWATVKTEPPMPQLDSSWANYVQGVLAGCAERGLQPGGFEAVIDSTVPIGGGLSSSAALEVATATLVEAMTGRQLDRAEKALLCQKAEHEYAGMPCGIMDQFSSVMGQEGCLMLLDCRSQAIEMVQFADPDVAVLIANTNVKHELTGSEYPERRAQCKEGAKRLGVAALRDATLAGFEAARDQLDDVLLRRARHVIGEIERTVQAAKAINQSDWPTVGRLMYESHASLRDDFEVSCEELDLMVELAQSIGPEGGVIGSRMTGGGFGGCTVSLVRAAEVDAVTEALHQGYIQRTGVEPTIFATRPARGACIVDGA